MDAAAQKEGERQVRSLLIEPLERLGLMKPAGLTKAAFEAMQDEICQRLAYMGALNLRGLCEELEGCGGGKDRDRFPMANVVLDRAMKHQPPVGDASPLMRAVFSHAVGAAALRDGYAPELMKWLRDNRKWPGSYVLGQVADLGRASARRAEDLRAVLEGSDGLSGEDVNWLGRRDAVVARCQDARDLGLSEAKAGAK